MGYETVVKKMSGFVSADVFDGGFDVVQFFAFVAPHQEHAALDAALAGEGDGLLDLLDLDAAIHGVEDSLGAAFGADPDAEAAEFGEKVEHLCVESIGAGDAFEGNAQAAAAHLGGIVANPFVVDGEDVVGDPDHVGGVGLKQPLDLIDNEQGIAAAVGLAKDLMAAPATLVWASAGGDEVDRTFAVRVAPGLDVAADVDGVTSGPGLAVEIGDLVALRRLVHGARVRRDRRGLAMLVQESVAPARKASSKSCMVSSPSPKTTKSAPAWRYSRA